MKKIIFIVCLIVNFHSFANNLLSKIEAKQAVLNLIKIKYASKNYLQDIRSWPTNISELLNTNYLDHATYKDYLIFENSGKLNIALKTTKENISSLQKYLANGIFDDKKNIFYIVINPNLKKILTPKLLPISFFCSNLHCPKY